MMKKPSGKYENPFIEFLLLDAEDVLTASGENFYEWDKNWNDNTDGDEFFS